MPNVILGLLGSRPDYRNTNRTAGLQALPLRDPESPSRAARSHGMHRGPPSRDCRGPRPPPIGRTSACGHPGRVESDFGSASSSRCDGRRLRDREVSAEAPGPGHCGSTRPASASPSDHGLRSGGSSARRAAESRSRADAWPPAAGRIRARSSAPPAAPNPPANREGPIRGSASLSAMTNRPERHHDEVRRDQGGAIDRSQAGTNVDQHPVRPALAGACLHHPPERRRHPEGARQVPGARTAQPLGGEEILDAGERIAPSLQPPSPAPHDHTHRHRVASYRNCCEKAEMGPPSGLSGWSGNCSPG